MLEQLSQLSTALQSIQKQLADLGYSEAAEAVTGVKLPPKPPTPPPPTPSPPGEVPPEAPDSPFKSSSMMFPPTDLETAYRTLAYEWDRAKIGSPRDEQGRPTDPETRYAPYTVARASNLDPGMVVPTGALRSLDAFTSWAKDNGFKQTISLRVDGLMRGAHGHAKWAKNPKGKKDDGSSGGGTPP